MTRVALALLALAACASDDDYIVILVSAPPAVRGAAALNIALTNADTTRMDSLALAGRDFPVTFSVTTPGRTGELAIAVDAVDAAGLVVGRGATTASTVGSTMTSLALDTADFVVNTDFADDQYPDSDAEAAGFQLAAAPDGTWTSVFATLSGATFSLLGRRFDVDGAPLATQLAAGTNAFAVNTTATTLSSAAAVAASAATTLIAWDQNGGGLGCRTLDATGRANIAQALLYSTETADVVSLAAIANGNFAASWNAIPAAGTVNEIHATIIKPDCTTGLAAPLVVSTGAVSARRAAVASSGEAILFAWVVAGALHVRTANSAGAFTSGDVVLIAKPATETVSYARVAAAPSGNFVLAVRIASDTTGGPGRIELYRLSPTGGILGTKSLVSDRMTQAFDNNTSFALASQPDGKVLVAWHTCADLGDGAMCGVFGRVMRDSGEAVTDAFTIPTTLTGDQRLPSVAALPTGFVAVWADTSERPPDVSKRAVRARVLYQD